MSAVAVTGTHYGGLATAADGLTSHSQPCTDLTAVLSASGEASEYVSARGTALPMSAKLQRSPGPRGRIWPLHMESQDSWSTWRLANRQSSEARCVSARAPARARSADEPRVRADVEPSCAVWGVSSSSVPAPVLVLEPFQRSVWGVSNSSVPASALVARAKWLNVDPGLTGSQLSAVACDGSVEHDPTCVPAEETPHGCGHGGVVPAWPCGCDSGRGCSGLVTLPRPPTTNLRPRRRASVRRPRLVNCVMKRHRPHSNHCTRPISEVSDKTSQSHAN